MRLEIWARRVYRISQSAPECCADTTRLALIRRDIGPGIDNRGIDVYPVTL